MARVAVKNVSKSYAGEKSKELTAVREVSFEIADGELVVLLGPPGCGKSTTLRMIAGLEEVSQGDLFIGDRRVNDVAPRDRDIAMVFPNYALYPHMTVYDNLAFGLKLRKYGSAETKRRVVDASSILQLDDLLERKPTALSSVERFRVALGRAIVRQPKVLLLDEPLSNLDEEMRPRMRVEIARLHQRLQTTMIYVTRDPIDALTMSDRIVAMNDGVVQQNDTPLILYKEPANIFVAGFLGYPPMNFIHGTLKQAGEILRFCEVEGGTIEAPFAIGQRPAARAFIGKRVILGIRPADIEIAKLNQKGGEPSMRFSAIAEAVEPMGAETNLHLQTGAHTLICRSGSVLDHREAGRRFQFEMDLGKAHLFDPVSTERIS